MYSGLLKYKEILTIPKIVLSYEYIIKYVVEGTDGAINAIIRNKD